MLPLKCGLLATYLYTATHFSTGSFGLQGKYITAPSKAAKPSPAAEDEMTQQELWNFCEKIIGCYLGQD